MDETDPTRLHRAVAAEPRLEFHTTRDGPPGPVIPLEPGAKMVVGRSQDVTVVIRDPDVSRRHALVVHESDGVHVIDLRSTNGTFVNGEPAGADSILADGDRVTFGATSAIFRGGANPGSVGTDDIRTTDRHGGSTLEQPRPMVEAVPSTPAPSGPAVRPTKTTGRYPYVGTVQSLQRPGEGNRYLFFELRCGDGNTYEVRKHFKSIQVPVPKGMPAQRTPINMPHIVDGQVVSIDAVRRRGNILEPRRIYNEITHVDWPRRTITPAHVAAGFSFTVFAVGLVLIAIVWLGIQRENREVKIPSVAGLTQQLAEKRLHDAGFDKIIVGQTNPATPQGCTTFPPANESRPTNMEVTLTCVP